LDINFPESGKSAITVQYVENHFVDSYNPTIENAFNKVIKYKGEEYNTEILDTAGQVWTNVGYVVLLFLT
jgi:small GTP-binding protein